MHSKWLPPLSNAARSMPPQELIELQMTTRGEAVPQSLLRGIVTTINDRFYGLQSLALASLRERTSLTRRSDRTAGHRRDSGNRRAEARAPKDMDRAVDWRVCGDLVPEHERSMASNATRREGLIPASSAFSTGGLAPRMSKRTFEREWLPLLIETLLRACSAISSGCGQATSPLSSTGRGGTARLVAPRSASSPDCRVHELRSRPRARDRPR